MHKDVNINKTTEVLYFSSFFFYFYEIESRNINAIVSLIIMKYEKESIFFFNFYLCHLMSPILKINFFNDEVGEYIYAI